MVWEGKQSVVTGRKIVGATNPLQSEPGTVRGDFCIDVGRNLIHGVTSWALCLPMHQGSGTMCVLVCPVVSHKQPCSKVGQFFAQPSCHGPGP